MTSVEAVIHDLFGKIISNRDMNEVSEELRGIAADPMRGLGVALLVAWQHGLKIGHIPQDPDGTANSPRSAQGASVISADDGCPYIFVHVPVRQFRSNKAELVRRKIMNSTADPARFIYHEDGLVGAFSFQNPESVDLTERDIGQILEALTRQGFLVGANINNRQVQFKDLGAKRRLEESGEEIYVRVEDRLLTHSVRLPNGHNRKEVLEYIEQEFQRRTACNYCSVQTLTPHEATIHSAHAKQQDQDLATARNYQLGFTFAPFGDPRNVFHFLAWDFPHINDLVINMEPQAYSFSDLIRLVRVINRDIRDFSDRNGTDSFPVSGSCNHFAGNSIYHQHYQFFHIPDLPLLRASAGARPLVTYNGIEVQRIDKPWPSPAFLIRSSDPGRDADVMVVADRVAREWRLLGDGIDRHYGNRIALDYHTQNIFVTITDDRPTAIFIPRHRRKLHALDQETKFEKRSAGVLEMMGYFVIDDAGVFDEISRPTFDRRALGDSWLSKLSPDRKAIEELERNISISLSKEVQSYECRIDMILSGTQKHSLPEIYKLAATVRRDRSLTDPQRGHLYSELLSIALRPCAAESN